MDTYVEKERSSPLASQQVDRNQRQFPRYNCAFLVEVKTKDERAILALPETVNVNGCYFGPASEIEDAARAWGDPEVERTNLQEIVLFVPENTMRARVKRAWKRPGSKLNGNERSGLAVNWELETQDAVKLEGYLRSQPGNASATDRVTYLTSEQKVLSEEVRHWEDCKIKRQRFIYVLVIAYLAFVLVPFRFKPEFMTAHFAGFYGIAGIWASIAPLVATMRHLRFLAAHYRTRAWYYSAINLSRKYVFQHDPEFWKSTVFPPGLHYAVKGTGPRSDEESQFQRLRTASDFRNLFWYPPVFFLFIQMLFVIGLVHFAGVTMHSAIKSSDFGTPNGSFFFDYSYFKLSVSGCSGIILGWLHFTCLHCMIYARNVWEANRIDSNRPNPRFMGLGQTAPKLDRILKSIVTPLFVTYGCLGFIVLAFHLQAVWPTWLTRLHAATLGLFTPLPGFLARIPEFLRSALEFTHAPWVACFVFILFIVYKFIYTKLAIRFEDEHDKARHA